MPSNLIKKYLKKDFWLVKLNLLLKVIRLFLFDSLYTNTLNEPTKEECEWNLTHFFLHWDSSQFNYYSQNDKVCFEQQKPRKKDIPAVF